MGLGSMCMWSHKTQHNTVLLCLVFASCLNWRQEVMVSRSVKTHGCPLLWRSLPFIEFRRKKPKTKHSMSREQSYTDTHISKAKCLVISHMLSEFTFCFCVFVRFRLSSNHGPQTCTVTFVCTAEKNTKDAPPVARALHFNMGLLEWTVFAWVSMC